MKAASKYSAKLFVIISYTKKVKLFGRESTDSSPFPL